MAVSVEQLAAYVNARLSEPGSATAEWVRNRVVLTDLVLDATVMIDERLKEQGLARIPNEIYNLAIRQLGSELWNRANSPNGRAMWGPDGQTAYLASDPMQSVLPLLRPYLPMGSVG